MTLQADDPLHPAPGFTFHLHYGVIRDVLAPRILLSLAPGLVVIVRWDDDHGPPLEPLEWPTLPFLGIGVDVRLEILSVMLVLKVTLQVTWPSQWATDRPSEFRLICPAETNPPVTIRDFCLSSEETCSEFPRPCTNLISYYTTCLFMFILL